MNVALTKYCISPKGIRASPSALTPNKVKQSSNKELPGELVVGLELARVASSPLLDLDNLWVAPYSPTMKVSLTPHQASFIDKKMKTGGYRSRREIVREALRVYKLVEDEDYNPELEKALRQALRSPARKYTRNHFSNLASRGKKIKIAA